MSAPHNAIDGLSLLVTQQRLPYRNHSRTLGQGRGSHRRPLGRHPLGEGPSALVALDRPCASHLSGVGILTELALGLSLAKQVPALVELDLKVPKAGVLLVWRDLV